MCYWSTSYTRVKQVKLNNCINIIKLFCAVVGSCCETKGHGEFDENAAKKYFSVLLKRPPTDEKESGTSKRSKKSKEDVNKLLSNEKVTDGNPTAESPTIVTENTAQLNQNAPENSSSNNENVDAGNPTFEDANIVNEIPAILIQNASENSLSNNVNESENSSKNSLAQNM